MIELLLISNLLTLIIYILIEKQFPSEGDLIDKILMAIFSVFSSIFILILIGKGLLLVLH